MGRCRTVCHEYADHSGGYTLKDVRRGSAPPTIQTSTTPCNYGGLRTWLVCLRCGSRRTRLYGYPYPICRRCSGMIYYCQTIGRMQRIDRTGDKLLRRLLHADPETCSWPPQKPKGMHWRTFWRHFERVERLDNEWVGGVEADISRRFARFKSRKRR
jgi:hypothetical protein